MDILLSRTSNQIEFDTIVSNAVRDTCFSYSITEEKQIQELINQVKKIFNKNLNVVRDDIFSKDNFNQESILVEVLVSSMLRFINALKDTEADALIKIREWANDNISNINDSIDIINMANYIKNNVIDEEGFVIDNYNITDVIEGEVVNDSVIDYNDFNSVIDYNGDELTNKQLFNAEDNNKSLVCRKVDLSTDRIFSLVYKFEYLNSYQYKNDFITNNYGYSDRIGIFVNYDNPIFNLGTENYDGVFIKVYFEEGKEQFLNYRYSQNSERFVENRVYLNGDVIRYGSQDVWSIQKRCAVTNKLYIILAYMKNNRSTPLINSYFDFSIDSSTHKKNTIDINFNKAEIYYYNKSSKNSLFNLTYAPTEPDKLLLKLDDFYTPEENYDGSNRVYTSQYFNGEYMNYYKLFDKTDEGFNIDVDNHKKDQSNEEINYSRNIILNKNIKYKLAHLKV